MSAVSISPLFHGLILLWLLLLALVWIYHLILCGQLRRTGRLALNLLLLLVTLAMLRAVITSPASLPLLLKLLVPAAMTGLGVWQQGYIRRWRRRHISPMSVKESFDNLPAGLCYSWPGGLVKLANAAMDRISRDLAGTPISDADAFWTALTEGRMEGSVQGGEHPIVRLPDGTAYSFQRNGITMDGSCLCELIATDISEEYRLGLEYAEKQEQARYMNARLKALSSSVKYMAMDKEAVETKIRIHDSLGSTLLMTKRYLLRSDSVEREELIRRWKSCVTLMKNEGEELWQRPYFTSREQTAALGIELVVEGELPTEPHLRPVIDDAIIVHVTNVLRHARGTRAEIAVSEDAGHYTLTFTNDGEPPHGEIRETGGLNNLRRETEAVGGSMEMSAAPRFSLRLTLPKEDIAYGLSRIGG